MKAEGKTEQIQVVRPETPKPRGRSIQPSLWPCQSVILPAAIDPAGIRLSAALHPISSNSDNAVLELLPPGSFATLDNHPSDLPPFQVIQCRGGRCLVRQQAWGKHVQWEVEHQRLHSA